MIDEKETDPWIVNVKGEPGSRYFEISVLRASNLHGIASYGWFDDNKLLVTHNGGPCTWPITERVWNKAAALANEVAQELNEEEVKVTAGVLMDLKSITIGVTDYKVLSSHDGWLYVRADNGDTQFVKSLEQSVTTQNSKPEDCPTTELIAKAKGNIDKKSDEA